MIPRGGEGKREGERERGERRTRRNKGGERVRERGRGRIEHSLTLTTSTLPILYTIGITCMHM